MWLVVKKKQLVCGKLMVRQILTRFDPNKKSASVQHLLKLQSWTKVLTHLSKTNTFYRRSSVILKSIFLSMASTPSPPFQCCNMLRGRFDLVTTLKRGEGVEMSKLGIEKLTRLTKRVFFWECLNYFCP